MRIARIAFVTAYTAVLVLSNFAKADAQLLNGAGATFPYPLYSKWFSEYKNNVNPQVQINYQSIGSGGGIQQLIAGTVDFGASDAPMSDDELTNAKKSVFHIPTVLGAVVVTYRLDGMTEKLQFTPELIADIYLGKITKWSDPKIQAVNPKAKLPNGLDIIVTSRSDGSGTTSVFTDYLAKVSGEWKTKVGAGKSVKWPVGLGGKGNEGVTGLVKQTNGAIGYVELVYAETNKLPVAAIKNKAGNFVLPDLKTVTAAAAGALKAMPEDFRVSITNPDGKNAYPIASFTYLLVFEEMAKAQGQALKGFLKWAMGPGQKIAGTLLYAPLPDSLIKKVNSKVEKIKLK